MKVLSIGNSFSQDAQRYLHEIAKADGYELQTANINIGGCTLETHHLNLLSDEPNYDLEINGKPAVERISICNALKLDDWDYVTLQQASHLSADFETYVPYISALADEIRKVLPKAKILIHQTWAYEDGSERLFTVTRFKTAKEMFSSIEKSYDCAVDLIKADGLIPSGKAMFFAMEDYKAKVHRDTFHSSLGLGRYMIALTWYGYLTGRDFSCNDFNEFDENVSAKEREIAINSAQKALNKIQPINKV